MLRRVATLLLFPVALLGAFRLGAWWRERDGSVPSGIVRIATPLGRVAAQVGGPRAGPPILIVPGTAGWSGFWRDVSAHLAARGHRVHSVDLPPFGFSDHDPRARYDRPAQAARLAAVLAAGGDRPAVVVAHSFGAGAATELALRHPRRVARLVLVDPALGRLDPREPGGVALLDRAAVAQPLVAATLTNPWALGPLMRSMLHRKDAAEPWRETLRRPMRRPGTTAAYAAWAPALFAGDDGGLSRRSVGLAAMRPPVALIWGEEDTVTPMAEGVALARLLRAPLVRLPGVGHVPHVEDPVRFRQVLEAVIEGRP